MNLADFCQFLKEQAEKNISVSAEKLEELRDEAWDNGSDSIYSLLNNTIKHSAIQALQDFIKEQYENMTPEELIYCGRWVTTPESVDLQYLIANACKHKAVRDNITILRLLTIQSFERVWPLSRLVANDSAIFDDPEALGIILSQEKTKQLKSMINVCEVPSIREDKVALRQIGKQVTDSMQRLMKEISQVEAVRQNRSLFKMIADMDSWDKQWIMKMLCKSEELSDMGFFGTPSETSADSSSQTPIENIATYLKDSPGGLVELNGAVLATLANVGADDTFKKIYKELCEEGIKVDVKSYQPIPIPSGDHPAVKRKHMKNPQQGS